MRNDRLFRLEGSMSYVSRYTYSDIHTRNVVAHIRIRVRTRRVGR
jgi:hypothetical protein